MVCDPSGIVKGHGCRAGALARIVDSQWIPRAGIAGRELQSAISVIPETRQDSCWAMRSWRSRECGRTPAGQSCAVDKTPLYHRVNLGDAITMRRRHSARAVSKSARARIAITAS